MSVQQVHQYCKSANPVDERVMNLDDERCTSTVHALHNHGLPGRQFRVEAGGGHDLGHVEDIPKGCLRRHDNPPEVEAQFEGIVFYEPRSPTAEGTYDDVRSKTWDDLGQRCEAVLN
jgi:hypothetical protein